MEDTITQKDFDFVQDLKKSQDQFEQNLGDKFDKYTTEYTTGMIDLSEYKELVQDLLDLKKVNQERENLENALQVQQTMIILQSIAEKIAGKNLF